MNLLFRKFHLPLYHLFIPNQDGPIGFIDGARFQDLVALIF
jgi:hypothetical protein